jgi:2-polyprenyl-3-methyl-5-hydroxy-6-metoxy-1,4-benzoquinol methylase
VARIDRQPSPRYGRVDWFEQKFRAEDLNDASAYYGHAVNGYQRFRYAYLLDLLQRSLPADRSLAVLDVGCGVGDFLAQLQHVLTTEELVGVDFVGPVVETAAARFPQMTFEQDSLPHLSRLAQKYDLIIASEVLYYLSAVELPLALRRLRQLLKEEGHLFISTTIAPHTFTIASLTEAVEPYFAIRRTWLQNSRPYLGLVHWLQLANQIERAHYSEEWSPRYRRVYRWLQAPILGRFLLVMNRFLVHLSRPVLRSVALPRFLTRLGDRLGSRAASNIIMLCQKEGAREEAQAGNHPDH